MRLVQNQTWVHGRSLWTHMCTPSSLNIVQIGTCAGMCGKHIQDGLQSLVIQICRTAHIWRSSDISGKLVTGMLMIFSLCFFVSVRSVKEWVKLSGTFLPSIKLCKNCQMQQPSSSDLQTEIPGWWGSYALTYLLICEWKQVPVPLIECKHQCIIMFYKWKLSTIEMKRKMGRSKHNS